MKKLPLCFFFFLVISTGQLCLGQSIGLRHYGVDEGLPKGDIYQIIQDQKGFIWVASGEGLARFDGHEMYSYTERDGLAESFVSAIKNDTLRNGIWIGHSLGVLSFYNRHQDSIRKIKVSPENLLSRIQQIHIAKEAIWALTEREGLIKVDFSAYKTYNTPSNEKTLRLKYETFHYPLLVNHSERCNVFEKLSEREFLVGTDSGLFVAMVKDKKFIFTQSIEILRGVSVFSIKKKDKGQTGFWIGTKGKGIYEFFSVESVKKVFSNNKELAKQEITDILEDKRGKIWLGTKNNGVFRIETSKKRERILHIEHYGVKNGLPSEAVTCILQDYEGSIWIGTEKDGLVQILNEMFEIYTFQHGLISENILSILRINENELLLGTDQNITLLNQEGRTSTFSNYLPNLSESRIKTMLKDSLGRIWIGTERKGLFIYDPSKKRLKTIRDVPDKSINKIISDDKGNIWIATNEWGLFKYIYSEKRFSQILPTNTVQINKIQSIYKDVKNRIWIASPDYTLTYIEGEKITVLDAVSEFSQVKATCFTEDAEDRLWIGTEGTGVFSYSEQEIKKYTTANGLASNYSYFIAADRNYNIWIGSRKGITRLRPKDDLAKVYHQSDGLIGMEANKLAVEKDFNGDLWFGTTRGLIHYIRQNDHINLVRPKVVLSRFRVFGKEYSLEDKAELPYDDYSLRFDFKTITFRYPEKVKYKYKLEGFDENWSEAVSQNFAYYSHLEDGSYTFEVLATNDDGIWAISPATYSFSIATPFWKRTWFLAIATLLGFLLFVGYVRLRTQNLEKQRKLLAEEVEKKTKKLQLQYRELEEANSMLLESEKELSQANSIKDQMFSIISHDLRSPLATLQNFLKIFISYRNAFTEEEINKVTRDINKSLNNVGDLLENLLQWSRAQMGHLEIELQPLSVVDHIQKNVELFLPTAKNKRINLQVSSIDESLAVEADPNLLNFILRNLISNAIKFTEIEGTVTLGASATEEKNDEKRRNIHISVRDTGIGMSEEVAQKIFAPDQHITTRGTANEKGTGLGLMVCKEFVEKQKGKIWIESKEGEGTTFTFSVWES